MPIDTALIEAVLTPVAGEVPAGRDLRYDPRYEQVKEARREDLELPPGGLATVRKLADYGVVLKLGRALIATETKDLQIAAWLAEALLKRDGLIGLATGLQVVHGILDKFWDGCFPTWDADDPELRAGPLEWIGDKFDLPARMITFTPPGFSFLDYQVSRTVPSEAEAEGNQEKKELRDTALAEKKTPPEVIDRAIGDSNKSVYRTIVTDCDAAIAALASVEKLADEKFGRDAPSFLKLRGSLDDMRRTAGGILSQKLIDDPDPIVDDDDAAGDVALDVDLGDGSMSVEPVSAADAARRIAISAAWLRKADATNPGPYLTLRGLRWGELRAAMQTGELNPRLLEAPPTVIRARLKTLLLDGKWPELLEQCEGVMATAQGRGWLDLQRYSMTACAQLGGSYDGVGAAVRDALRVLLAAIPQLPEMTLMDDTPTANAETRAWLTAEHLLPDNATGGAASEAPAGDDADGGAAEVSGALEMDAMTSRHGGMGTPRRTRPTRDVYEQARGEVQQGRTKRGIEMLLEEIAREQSARGRFLRKTQLASIMVESGLDAVARPILERLIQTIDERKLDEWESGPLVAQPMSLMCRVLDRADEGSSPERHDLYLRVCRLDAMQAMALTNG